LTIRFPVLRELSVSGYGLFENSRSSGIEHPFSQGVHVIVGINGLGKTTLLNILYRSLLGPNDMSKDDTGLASSQHKLVDWRNRRFFRARVRDEARNALAKVKISFGARIVTVKRSLRTLQVESLLLYGQPEDATQERYEELICELSKRPLFSTFMQFFGF
jgi:hypothetical protein